MVLLLVGVWLLMLYFGARNVNSATGLVLIIHITNSFLHFTASNKTENPLGQLVQINHLCFANEFFLEIYLKLHILKSCHHICAVNIGK